MANCSGVDDSYTKALLHMDGVDASTTFTDESGKTWTAVGNAQIDTAQSVFGGASGLFDGAGDLISTANSSDFDIASGDFTIDLRFRYNSTAGSQTLLGKRANTATNTPPFLIFSNGTTLIVYFYINGVLRDLQITISGNISSGTWYHIAFVRNGDVFTVYLDGISKNTETWSGSLSSNSDNVRIGSDSDGFPYNGWIDEFRFSKGIARWTANFTPPTSEYCPSSLRKFQRASIVG